MSCFIIRLYLQKLPQTALQNDTFYCRPLGKYTSDSKWYSHQARGKNYLGNNMVKNMFKDAKIDGDYTNHSLRASGASEMFVSHVPEKVILVTAASKHFGSTKKFLQYKSKLPIIFLCMGTLKDFTKEVEKLQDTEVEKAQGTNIESLQDSSRQMAYSVTPTNHFSFPMPAFSPVINSNGQGTINFTINVCPSGNNLE